MSAPEPDPWAEGKYGPSVDPLPPDLADVIAAFFAGGHPAEAALNAAEPEPEAEP